LKSNFYIPETALIKEVIQSLWQIEGPRAFETSIFLPKGIVEIIFNFSAGLPIVAHVGKKTIPAAAVFYQRFQYGTGTNPASRTTRVFWRTAPSPRSKKNF
jgi:hypothetical protein